MDFHAFHRSLFRWYEAHGRHDLPWRQTTDPYAIYISEIMLQQTQVKTVLERYYFPFLKRFPTLQALAEARRDEVLKSWEGLGYYSRAANLHKAAAQAAPKLPSTVDALLELPGIGQNTAHAIAAFAFRQPVAVLEANVKRVVARLFALENPSPAELWQKAGQLLDRQNPFDYNQAMMDVGAMICTPKAPDCLACPAAAICAGKADPEAYPAKKAKKAVPVRQKEIVVFADAAGRWFLAPRETRFLGGLYGFAEYEAGRQAVYHENRAYHLPRDGRLLGEVQQTYSHFKLQANVWLVKTGEAGQSEGWFSSQEMAELALSGADYKVVKLILKHSVKQVSLSAC